MAITLVAHEQQLLKIFSDDYVFNIPGYQRPYAWTTEHAGELLDDLLGFIQANPGPVEAIPPYFLGSIVLIKEDSIPNADVVDGQQRLTTLTILLAAIRAAISRANADEITPLIYEKGSTIRGTKDRFRLSLRVRDQEFFQTNIQREDGFSRLIGSAQELSDSQSNIRANAGLFKDRLAGLPEHELLQLAQFIATRCFLVVVATPDLDSAYRIFSVLNNRGLDLSMTDLLKAEIIGVIPEDQRDIYTNKWEEIEERLGRDAFRDLFSHITMVYRKSKLQSALLKEFREHVTASQPPIRFIDEILVPMAKAYEQISDADYESTQHAEKINEHLKWLNRLEFTDWVPPAIAFTIRHYQTAALMLNFFYDLERLAYAMLILKFNVNNRIEHFSRLTREIEIASNLQGIPSALQLNSEEKQQVYQQLNGSLKCCSNNAVKPMRAAYNQADKGLGAR